VEDPLPLEVVNAMLEVRGLELEVTRGTFGSVLGWKSSHRVELDSSKSGVLDQQLRHSADMVLDFLFAMDWKNWGSSLSQWWFLASAMCSDSLKTWQKTTSFKVEFGIPGSSLVVVCWAMGTSALCTSTMMTLKTPMRKTDLYFFGAGLRLQDDTGPLIMPSITVCRSRVESRTE